MIFISGHRTWLELLPDQRELQGLFTPCLARGCNGRRCRVYRAEKWCTIYFCIPLVKFDQLDVVKCETCGDFFPKEAYLQEISTRHRERPAAPPPPRADSMQRLVAAPPQETPQETVPQETVPLVAATVVMETPTSKQSSTNHIQLLNDHARDSETAVVHVQDSELETGAVDDDESLPAAEMVKL